MGKRLDSNEVAAIARQLSAVFKHENFPYSQDEIAGNVGIDQGRISGFCKGKFKTESKNLLLLCKYAKEFADVHHLNLPSDALDRESGQLQFSFTVQEILQKNERLADELMQLAKKLRQLKA